MKRISMIALACLLALSVQIAFGQTRRRTTNRGSRTASTKKQSTTTAAAATQTAAARVAEQIKSLGKFLYLYGPISKDLAGNESGSQSPTATETMQRNRAKLRDVFRAYRTQMDELETLFSSSNELRPYYTRLLGVAASAQRAEDAAAAGRYTEAGNSLLEVMNRLTDVLLDMR